MLLADIAAASAAVAGTRSRLAKRDLLATALQAAAPEEVEIVVAYLAGEVRQRRTGVGWASLGSLPPPAAAPTLTPVAVDAELERISALSGPGSAALRTAAVADLFARATLPEQRLLRGLLSGEVRQGALDAAMLDAVAAASGVPLDSVRRAAMLRGSTGPVAVAALVEGAAAVDAFGLTVGQPVRPMLAASAPDVEAALERIDGRASLDAKLDGIRIQVHRDGDDVRVYTRSLDDITARLPEVVDVARSLPGSRLVLDGEAMTLDDAGRPRAFQETASRTATQATEGGSRAVAPFFFDVLHIDGDDLLDEPLEHRLGRLDDLVPESYRVARVSDPDLDSAQAFFDAMIGAGQEGVVVKSLAAPYAAGRRGSGWVKVKPRHTLDLVVLAVEWGSGRRRGWLSNIHLGARDLESGEFVMLGKTFKGMTDAMLTWQTERFAGLALDPETIRDHYVVPLHPVQVVEIAFDGVQRSSRYAGGLALRFARVVRYRDDKTAAEADTISTVRAFYVE